MSTSNSTTITSNLASNSGNNTSTIIMNGDYSPPTSLNSHHQIQSVINNQPTRNGSTKMTIDHQPKKNTNHYGPISPPLSPNSVIDPFSVDYTLYATRYDHQQHHRFCQQRDSLIASPATPTPVAAQNCNSLNSRPRSRSGSASTMARMLDMFRGRSNSIATEHHKQHHHHHHCSCKPVSYFSLNFSLVCLATLDGRYLDSGVNPLNDMILLLNINCLEFYLIFGLFNFVIIRKYNYIDGIKSKLYL